MSGTAELWPEVKPDAARRLMLAAVDSFAERGYHATTTRDIATAAGMSPAALYVHFPSKAAVLFAISRSGHEQTLALVREVLARSGEPREQIRLLVEEFVAWHARRHRIARVVQYEFSALPEREYEVVAELRRATERVVREVIAAGAAPGPLPRRRRPARRAGGALPRRGRRPLVHRDQQARPGGAGQAVRPARPRHAARRPELNAVGRQVIKGEVVRASTRSG